MGWVNSIAVLMMAAFLPGACGSDEPAPRPNVILLVMDTTRADRCSVNGYGRPTTPALEALAREGINFRNTWSPSGWAGPAHASIFTGFLPENHGFRRSNRSYLDPGATTLAERLKDEGYRTACLTTNPIVAPEFGLVQGFESYFPMHLDGDPSYLTAQATHRKALDWAVRARDRGEQFFLFINDMEAHSPYAPPDSFREQFRDPLADPAIARRVMALSSDDLGEHNLGISRLTEEEIEALSDLYDAEIAGLDRAIGHFIAELRRNELLEDTLLIITSDHGENLGERGLVEHMFCLHRSIRHVPLVIRLPGGTRGGEVTDEVARLEDIYPTVLEVCGISGSADLDGQSLLGDLTDRRAWATMDASPRVISRILGERAETSDPKPCEFDYRAVFDGRLHWIYRSNGQVEVFDILTDPEERKPLKAIASGSPRAVFSPRKPPETGLLHH